MFACSMHKITSYLLLFIYANGLLAPVSPVINDMLAHAFWRAQHMATVHCVDGKYHVHYELYNAGKKDNKANSSFKSDETISIHIRANEKDLLFSFLKEVMQIREGVWLENPFVKISSPPPKVA
jgi:hypothetical protein